MINLAEIFNIYAKLFLISRILFFLVSSGTHKCCRCQCSHASGVLVISSGTVVHSFSIQIWWSNEIDVIYTQGGLRFCTLLEEQETGRKGMHLSLAHGGRGVAKVKCMFMILGNEYGLSFHLIGLSPNSLRILANLLVPAKLLIANHKSLHKGFVHSMNQRRRVLDTIYGMHT